jgi:hypothetical protein
VEITLRDVLYLLGLAITGGASYVGIVTRLTRLEALVHRLEKVEDDVADLQTSDARMGRELVALQARRRAQP